MFNSLHDPVIVFSNLLPYKNLFTANLCMQWFYGTRQPLNNSLFSSTCLLCSKPRSQTMQSWSSSSWRHWLIAICQQLTRNEGRSSWGRPPPHTRPLARASWASLPTSTFPTPWPHWQPPSTHQVSVKHSHSGSTVLLLHLTCQNLQIGHTRTKCHGTLCWYIVKYQMSLTSLRSIRFFLHDCMTYMTANK